MAVTFEDAVRKSMRAYWINTRDYDAMTSNKGKNRKYTKQYFDDIENEMVGKKPKDKKELEKEYK